MYKDTQMKSKKRRIKVKVRSEIVYATRIDGVWQEKSVNKIVNKSHRDLIQMYQDNIKFAQQ